MHTNDRPPYRLKSEGAKRASEKGGSRRELSEQQFFNEQAQFFCKDGLICTKSGVRKGLFCVQFIVLPSKSNRIII